jgi:2,3-bisphosphoglycerate-independent phosphoglycerate mutase
VIQPEEAGTRLAALSGKYDFVLFEYWRTDKAGHAMDFSGAVGVLETFDAMLGGILESLDPSGTLLLLTSDHGNIEDMTTKTHTRHPVPLIVYGADAPAFAARIGTDADLTAVAPLVLEYIAGTL